MHARCRSNDLKLRLITVFCCCCFHTVVETHKSSADDQLQKQHKSPKLAARHGRVNIPGHMERVPRRPNVARTVPGLLTPYAAVHAQRDRRVQHAGGPVLPDGRLPTGRHVPTQRGADVEQ